MRLSSKEKNKIYRKRHPFRVLLQSIKARCNTPNRKDSKSYYDKGIKCYLTEYEIEVIYIRDKASLMKKPSIDRIDNDGDYIFNNCQFIEMGKNSIKANSKSVLQFDLDGNFIKEYSSAKEASNSLKINHSHIVSVCNKKYGYKTIGNFIFRYKNDKNINVKNIIFGNRKPVVQYDLKGKFIREFKSLTEASNFLKISRPAISRVLLGNSKTAGKSKWKYKGE